MSPVACGREQRCSILILTYRIVTPHCAAQGQLRGRGQVAWKAWRVGRGRWGTGQGNGQGTSWGGAVEGWLASAW